MQTSLYFLQLNEPLDKDKKDKLSMLAPCPTGFIYIVLMTLQSIVQCIMGHNNCNMATWKMMSNALDIAFILRFSWP